MTTTVFVPSLRPKGRIRRTRRTPQPRAPVTELAAQVRCDVTVPIIFLMLASRLSPSLKAYPHRQDPAKWCFRFGSKAVLELSAEGQAEWIAGPSDVRRDVDALIGCARERLAEFAGAVPRQIAPPVVRAVPVP